MNRRENDILAALEARTLTADELATAARMTTDLAYCYVAQLIRAGKVVITAKRIGGDAAHLAKRPVNVYGLTGRDPALTIVARPRAEGDDDDPNPPRRPICKTAGSGQFAGPRYATGYANWGGRRNSA